MRRRLLLQIAPDGVYRLPYGKLLGPTEIRHMVDRALSDYETDVVAFCFPTEWGWYEESFLSMLIARAGEHKRAWFLDDSARNIHVLEVS